MLSGYNKTWETCSSPNNKNRIHEYFYLLSLKIIFVYQILFYFLEYMLSTTCMNDMWHKDIEFLCRKRS